MNKDLTAENSEEMSTRVKWVGFILMASGSLSFSNNTFIGEIISVFGAVLFLGECFYNRLRLPVKN